MADIQAGTIYADGGQVNATNLNAHVNNAVLVPGVISGKPAALSLTGADTALILQGGLLKKGTISQMQAAIAPDLASYVNRNGSVSMTGELTLSSSSPTGTLSAIPKTYVDTGLATKQASLGFTPVNKAGDTMAGTLTLQADPASAFQAATKQYVDTKASLTGATFTGPVVLPAGDPTLALQATTKTYVDTGLAGKISTGGATVAGTYLFSGKLQTSSAPTVANDVVNKSYIDGLASSLPVFAASAYFYTSQFPSNTVNTATFLTVLGTRTAGSTTLTINYSSLAARYYDVAKPFFLQEQYVGVATGTAGITGRLYKITSANIAARTFTITTPESTVFNGSLQLSLVYDSTSLALNQYGQNVKSIYLDMTAVSKMYVNYIADIISGSSAPASPSNTPIRCVNISGNANGHDVNQLICVPMRDFGRTSYIYSQDIAEGFGSNSLGCHIGFFYNNADGSNYYSYYAASFTIMTVLPPA